MNKIYIGLLGLGTVGKGFINTLEMNKEKIKQELGKELIVKTVLVNNLNKKRDIDTSNYKITDNINEILEDDNIDIVVELLGGLSPAFEYIKLSLLKNKHVVTANKAVVSSFSKEIYDICCKSNATFKFEASIGGGIPIINTIKENLSSNKINMSFEEALHLAQEKGFAEADPTSDLMGEDAVYKLSILSNTAFGKCINPRDIPSQGIKKINQEDIKYAEELGYNIKLLAIGDNTESELELSVEPTFIRKNHPLSSVKNEFNALFIEGNSTGEIMLYGKGAGGMATGSSVLSDVINISKYMKKDILLTNKEGKLSAETNKKHRYYIRLEVVDKAGVLGKIAESFGRENVSIESVVQKNAEECTVPLIFITHNTIKSALMKAISEIKHFDFVVGVQNIIRILN
jgi:homoserine dehydrogenase